MGLEARSGILTRLRLIYIMKREAIRMEAKRFIGKVLPDGHLSIPKDLAKQTGKLYEVILVSLDEIDVYDYTEAIAKEKGFSHYTEREIERIVHESRGIKG